MHPSEMTSNRFGFVGLNWAYEMPADVERSELLLLGQRLLQVVFGKMSLPQTIQLCDITSRLGFADSQQLHTVFRSTRNAGGMPNLAANVLITLSHAIHVLSLPSFA